MSDNLYVLRVRLSWAKGVWREIAITGDRTLDELHHAILDAFEWTDEDTYSFAMDEDRLDDRYTPESDLPNRQTHTTELDDLKLEEEQVFLYLFSDGERNQFPIKVMIVDDPDPQATYPDVVDENGESPDQELAYLDE
jgi:hypothetical protein